MSTDGFEFESVVPEQDFGRVVNGYEDTQIAFFKQAIDLTKRPTKRRIHRLGIAASAVHDSFVDYADAILTDEELSVEDRVTSATTILVESDTQRVNLFNEITLDKPFKPCNIVPDLLIEGWKSSIDDDELDFETLSMQVEDLHSSFIVSDSAQFINHVMASQQGQAATRRETLMGHAIDVAKLTTGLVIAGVITNAINSRGRKPQP